MEGGLAVDQQDIRTQAHRGQSIRTGGFSDYPEVTLRLNEQTQRAAITP
jgi:hypothetical protein